MDNDNENEPERLGNNHIFLTFTREDLVCFVHLRESCCIDFSVNSCADNIQDIIFFLG